MQNESLFTSDPFCVTCEMEQNGILICFNNTRCKKHEEEFEEFLRSELYQELKRLVEDDDE